MSTFQQEQEFPDEETTRAVLALATRAPSVHNTQPWRWAVGASSLHLFADPPRRLAATDPDGRAMTVSCGAALHHTRIALSAFGWHPLVHRTEHDPAAPDHLAAITVVTDTATNKDITLAAAIMRRRSDRRAYAAWDVPELLVRDLTDAAAEFGVVAVPVDDQQAAAVVVRAAAMSESAQSEQPGYLTELALWSGRHAGSRDGVPAANASVHPGLAHARGRFAVDPGDEGGVGHLLVLGTTSDDASAWLRAGEATSAILLAATAARLVCCPLSQPLDLPSARRLVRDAVLGGDMVPQMVLRVGWPRPGNSPLPATPRRALTDMVGPLVLE